MGSKFYAINWGLLKLSSIVLVSNNLKEVWSSDDLSYSSHCGHP